MAEERRYVLRRYWDSTCFLALLNDEEDAARCEQILEEAKRLSTEIYVSPLVQVEVVRPRGVPRPLAATQRERIRAFFENEYVKWRIIDRKIANDAQRLCWEHATHPRDAIHLAAAIDLNCDCLETSDRGLLRLDRSITGPALTICRPGAYGQGGLVLSREK